MEHRFTKMHGCGNDFVVFDTFSGPLDLSREQVRHIADRRRGIGCDQVLLLGPAEDDGADVRYRIFNADGEEVMQCGNGARCAAVYLRQKGLLSKAQIIAETGAGALALTLGADGNVDVNMGRPDFDPARIPLAHGPEASLYRVELAGEAVEFAALALGNPHAVIEVRDVDRADVEGRGARLQQSGLFPAGVNVGFMQVLNPRAFRLRVFERGAGETLACGSGASAAMVAACRRGRLHGAAEAELRGGRLSLSWAGAGQPVYMSGPASTVYEGTLEL